jgi:signal transduction histidine kinase
VSADSAETVCFSVSDTGPGIRSDLIDHIFDPFTQGDVASDAVPEGTGLGLSISRELARLLGGDVDVASEEGAGSTFTLTLPR